MRDDFTRKTSETLANRAGNKCSNPKCGQLTSGPQVDINKALNVGVAAHITAASPGGPRYDASFAASDRKSIGNGIWLCQKCAKLVDNDPERYTVVELRTWRRTAEECALKEIEGVSSANNNPQLQKYEKIEKLMPGLLSEMKTDLLNNPSKREFILLSKNDIYNGDGSIILTYFLEAHPDLYGKILILKNYSLVSEITYNDVKRFVFSEELVDYLRGCN